MSGATLVDFGLRFYAKFQGQNSYMYHKSLTSPNFYPEIIYIYIYV